MNDPKTLSTGKLVTLLAVNVDFDLLPVLAELQARIAKLELDARGSREAT